MNRTCLTILMLLLVNFSLLAQSVFTGNPDSSMFQTHDIENFWKAFDMFKKDTAINPFGKNYIDVGSAGVKVLYLTELKVPKIYLL